MKLREITRRLQIVTSEPNKSIEVKKCQDAPKSVSNAHEIPFIELIDSIKIGKKMDEAKTEYQGAMNKLVEGKGNLILSVEKLKKMGAKAKKALPETIIKRAETDENEL